MDEEIHLVQYTFRVCQYLVTLPCTEYTSSSPVRFLFQALKYRIPIAFYNGASSSRGPKSMQRRCGKEGISDNSIATSEIMHTAPPSGRIGTCYTIRGGRWNQLREEPKPRLGSWIYPASHGDRSRVDPRGVWGQYITDLR